MHPLHDCLANRLAEKLRNKKVVVWCEEAGPELEKLLSTRLGFTPPARLAACQAATNSGSVRARQRAPLRPRACAARAFVVERFSFAALSESRQEHVHEN